MGRTIGQLHRGECFLGIRLAGQEDRSDGAGRIFVKENLTGLPFLEPRHRLGGGLGLEAEDDFPLLGGRRSHRGGGDRLADGFLTMSG